MFKTKDFHGHPGYLELTTDELKLHSEKNRDYTKGGDPLGNFFRRSALMKLYPGIDWTDPANVPIFDALKQWDAAMWMLSQGYEGEVENVDTRLRDSHVYLKISRTIRKALGLSR